MENNFVSATFCIFCYIDNYISLLWTVLVTLMHFIWIVMEYFCKQAHRDQFHTNSSAVMRYELQVRFRIMLIYFQLRKSVLLNQE